MRAGASALGLILLILAACAPATADVEEAVVQTIIALPTGTPPPSYTPPPTYTPPPSATPPPTYTRYPTFTPPPTEAAVVLVATPTLAPLPETFLELSGFRQMITENLEWSPCEKAIFYWEVSGAQKMEVVLHKVGDPGFSQRIVNDSGPGGGEALAVIDERAAYFVEVKRGPSSGWTLRGECQTPAT